MFKKLFGKPKQSAATEVKPHGQTNAMATIERLNEVCMCASTPRAGGGAARGTALFDP